MIRSSDLKRELLAAAERQQLHAALGSAGEARKSRRRWLERSYVGRGRRVASSRSLRRRSSSSWEPPLRSAPRASSRDGRAS